MSTDRPTATPRPRPARLALRIPDAGSSGLIDAADLCAEPLAPSLAAALAHSRSGAAANPPAWCAWPGVLGRAAAVATLGLVGLAALLHLAPRSMTEAAQPALGGQLAMHDASASPLVLTATPGSPRAGAPASAVGPRDRAVAAASDASPATIEPPPLTDVEAPAEAEAEASAVVEPTPAPTTAASRTTRARGRPDAKPAAPVRPTSAPAEGTARRSIPVECVLDPSRCPPPAGASPAPRDDVDRTDGTRPAPFPEKLSAAQLKAALASTKADARRCGPDHGADAGTTVRVQLSIEGATGLVVSATAQGEHAQGGLGQCVARALGQTRFPRFTAKRMGTLYSVRL
jgi:hypothetical protein